MKKLFILSTILLSTWATAQIPQVGESVTFAGITVHLDDTERRLVQERVDLLLGGSKSKLGEKLEKVQLFFPIIVPILEDEDIPTDFKYLALLESGFDPEAVSTSNAVGYWQMKAGTASDLGLRIDAALDERKNIFSATHGAAIYLKQSNDLFKNWVSALISYQLGRSGVSGKLPSNWKFASEIKLRDLPEAYIIKALAHKVAFDAVVPELPDLKQELVEYKNAKGKTLREIGAELGLQEGELRNWNSWLNASKVPSDKEYSALLYLSSEMANAMRKGTLGSIPINFPKSDIGFPVLERITQVTKNKKDPILYKINGKKGVLAVDGDNFKSIAERAGIDDDDFLEYNDMGERDAIIAGDVYYLERKDKKAKVPVHIVREGETLQSISQLYGVKLERLLKYNHLNNVQRLQVGRVLSLQGKASNESPAIVVEEKPKKEEKPEKERNKRDKKDKNKDKESEKPLIAVEPPKKEEVIIVEPKKEEEKIVVIVDNPNTEEPKIDTKPSNPQPTNPPALKNDDDEIIILDGKRVRKGDLKKINEGNTEQPRPVNPFENPVPDKKPTPQPSINEPKPAQPPVTDKKPIDEPKKIVEEPRPNNPFPTVEVKPVAEEKPEGSISHIVKNGDNYFSIGRLYGVSPNQIYEWNALAPDIVLFVGQELIIKKGNTTNNPKPSQSAPRPHAGAWRIHTVKTGENLFRIALNNGVTVEDLREWNNLRNNTIEIGQQLKIRK